MATIISLLDYCSNFLNGLPFLTFSSLLLILHIIDFVEMKSLCAPVGIAIITPGKYFNLVEREKYHI